LWAWRASPGSEAFRLRQILTDFHDADSERYFNHFATQAIFIRTDPTER
jgi:hypothetical protein